MKTMSLTQFLAEPTVPQNYEQYLKGFEDFIKNPLKYNLVEKTNEVAKDSGWKDALKQMVKLLENIDKFLEYILHPTKILVDVLMWAINYSYPLCVMAGTLAVIFYIAGHKKALKYVPIMLTIYVLLQAIGVCLK